MVDSYHFVGLIFADTCTHAHYMYALYNRAYFVGLVFAVRLSLCENHENWTSQNFPLYDNTCTLASGWSRSFPMVVMRLATHSSDSSSDEDRSSRTTHSCMMVSESIFSLNSSPMKRMLPRKRRRFFTSQASSSSMSCCFFSACVQCTYNMYCTGYRPQPVAYM